MILMISIYLLAGILIADRRGQFIMKEKSLFEFLQLAAVIVFWPFIVGVLYIDMVDEVKKNKGM
ncbi:hypothetical protein [Bacillus suaedaesalsae]|uniref:TMhelix containing protein n=1 Tax=Bacillus suaedaesalsae TaxID=2810349 RepID=A0ABS2DIM4_9BACI|nr:hypothetical protein [Bacillus suaedaesalsae]MBM6618350.1 hypothetical protein [Bacillus suaedaesalsae]